jgi:hypothetical protein
MRDKSTTSTVVFWSHEELLGLWILQKIEAAVFGTDEEVGEAVGVPIDGGGAGVMAFDVAVTDIAFIGKQHEAVALARLAQKLGVFAVDEDVLVTVAIPVHEAEFTAATFACAAVIDVEQFAILIGKDALRWLQTVFCPWEKTEVTFVIQHHKIRETVLIPIHGNGCGAPLGQKGFAFRP